MTRDECELRERIWASCGDEHGLSERALEEHVEAIVRMVKQARRRRELEREAMRLRGLRQIAGEIARRRRRRRRER